MRRLMVIVGALVAVGVGIVAAWRRNPRIGTRFTNEVLNPFLVERGISGAGRSELGTLEHVGRRSGERHLTPIYPVSTPDGFRVTVPLGPKSEWARNVLAAGHCRLQLHDTVYDLDEPVLLAAGEMADGGTPASWILDRLGVQYLLLRRFAERAGSLDEVTEEPPVAQPQAEEIAAVGASSRRPRRSTKAIRERAR